MSASCASGERACCLNPCRQTEGTVWGVFYGRPSRSSSSRALRNDCFWASFTLQTHVCFALANFNLLQSQGWFYQLFVSHDIISQSCHHVCVVRGQPATSTFTDICILHSSQRAHHTNIILRVRVSRTDDMICCDL